MGHNDIQLKLGIIMKTIKKAIMFITKVFFAILAIDIIMALVYIAIMLITGTIPATN